MSKRYTYKVCSLTRGRRVSTGTSVRVQPCRSLERGEDELFKEEHIPNVQQKG